MSSVLHKQSVITRLNGGLGNQMFQYAAGRALADRLSIPLKMDLSEFETYHLRRYELDKFKISAGLATSDETAGFVINPSGFQRSYSRLAISLGFGFNKIAFKQRKFGYDNTFEKIRQPMYLNGYWQSEKYFKSAESELRNELSLIGKLGETSQKILDGILQCPAVSMHIRRGDYITNPSAALVHGVCSLDYYYSAIGHIIAHVDNPHFFVFSDDPQWAKDNLKINYPIQFVEANGPDRGVEDMWLMKSCNHHIIANSSFSWWAAWLNDRLDKIVVAPRIWFLDNKIDTNDLIPERWHRI
ncbi:MAG: alpha-1,2-fucosyltransferase [Anaerolineales bacterium]